MSATRHPAARSVAAPGRVSAHNRRVGELLRRGAGCLRRLREHLAVVEEAVEGAKDPYLADFYDDENRRALLEERDDLRRRIARGRRCMGTVSRSFITEGLLK